MKKAGAWILLLAIVVGIGYALYVAKFSGSSVLETQIEFSGGDGGDFEIEPVSLEPAMNPVRVNLSARLRGDRASARYYVKMHDPNGEEIWNESGLFPASDGDNNQSSRNVGASVHLFDVAEPGIYRLRGSISSRRMSSDLRSASLDIRRNVATFEPTMLIGIGIVAALGLILMALGLKGEKQGSRRGS